MYDIRVGIHNGWLVHYTWGAYPSANISRRKMTSLNESRKDAANVNVNVSDNDDDDDDDDYDDDDGE